MEYFRKVISLFTGRESNLEKAKNREFSCGDLKVTAAPECPNFDKVSNFDIIPSNNKNYLKKYFAFKQLYRFKIFFARKESSPKNFQMNFPSWQRKF